MNTSANNKLLIELDISDEYKFSSYVLTALDSAELELQSIDESIKSSLHQPI